MFLNKDWGVDFSYFNKITEAQNKKNGTLLAAMRIIGINGPVLNR